MGVYTVCPFFPRDPLHQEVRDNYIAATGDRSRSSRFREHDELRYSLRSVWKATRSWRNTVWHIVSADVADPDDTRDVGHRLGLVPQWMNIQDSWMISQTGQPRIQLHHGLFHVANTDSSGFLTQFVDTQLFQLAGSAQDPVTEADVDVWRAEVLPTFNR